MHEFNQSEEMEIENNQTTTYEYDADGRLIAKHEGTTTTHYNYAPNGSVVTNVMTFFGNPTLNQEAPDLDQMVDDNIQTYTYHFS